MSTTNTNAPARRGESFPSLFDNFFSPWNDFFDRSWLPVVTVPSVNISEKGGSYKVEMAAPGLKKEDFKIDLDGDMLTISAQKEVNQEQKEEKFTKKEYNYTSFSRSFYLPDSVNREKIEATYENGVLILTLPKKEEAKNATQKAISIK